MADKERLEPALIKVGIVVVLGTIMSILDTTIVAVALHTLSGDFKVNFSTIQWVTTGYLLSLAVVIPVSGWAIHRIGAKTVYMVSLALFILGSALCGFAWSATSLIFFRVLQGLGGGMIMPVGQAIMARAAGPQRMACRSFSVQSSGRYSVDLLSPTRRGAGSSLSTSPLVSLPSGFRRTIWPSQSETAIIDSTSWASCCCRLVFL
jgi:MFS family permease